MSQVVDAVRTFFENLAGVRWDMLGLALLVHYARLLARVPAWRNIIRAAYPGTVVPYRAVLGSYFAGVGVNAIAPARSGDLLKLYLVKHRVEGSTYPTLTTTLLVETVFDMLVAGGLIVWALSMSALPGLDVIPELPAIDWSWPLNHPKAAITIAIVWGVVVVLLLVIAVRRVRELKQRLKQGFAILGDRPRFLRQVVLWQAISWLFRLLSVYLFLEAFGVPATIHNAALVLVVQSLSTLFPFTPGGVGTQQGLIVYVFRRAAEAVPATALLSFSVGMHIATTAAGVLGGFVAIFLMLGTLRWKRVVVPEEEKAYARGP